MRKLPSGSPTERRLPFEYDTKPAEEAITALGGAPIVVQTFRALGLPASVQRNLNLKQRKRGFDEATHVESFVLLNALGGDCLDDFGALRDDKGLAELIGHESKPGGGPQIPVSVSRGWPHAGSASPVGVSPTSALPPAAQL